MLLEANPTPNDAEIKGAIEGNLCRCTGYQQIVDSVRAASEMGQLFGSVTSRDISDAVTEAGFTIDRSQIILNKAIKILGLHEVEARLHQRAENINSTDIEPTLSGPPIARTQDILRKCCRITPSFFP